MEPESTECGRILIEQDSIDVAEVDEVGTREDDKGGGTTDNNEEKKETEESESGNKETNNTDEGIFAGIQVAPMVGGTVILFI